MSRRSRGRAAWGARCALCGRAVLPGEPVHHFRDPELDAHERVVCPLCPRRAVARGWARSGGSGAAGRSAPAA